MNNGKVIAGAHVLVDELVVDGKVVYEISLFTHEHLSFPQAQQMCVDEYFRRFKGEQ